METRKRTLGDDEPAKQSPRPPKALRACSVRLDEIVDLLQQTPESLAKRWVRDNDESSPLKARQVSYTEIEIVIGRRSQ